MPDVYQFIHPGYEHGEDSPGRKRWNTELHRRKFLCSPGRYVVGPDATPTCDELFFWGEWEPESEVEALSAPVAWGPRWLHRPYYVRPVAYLPAPRVVVQNTDPFVFGECFQYTLCRQLRRPRNGGPKRPTPLRDVEPGSLILFGAPKKEQGFLLDTVFVTADGGILHSVESWSERLDGRISETYADVTMRSVYAEEPVQAPLRHYVGATFDARVDGMFSFAPALPLSEARNGFARPAIKLDGVVNPSLPMGAKRARNVGVDEVRRLWNAVVEQVVDAGLALGFSFDLPPRRPG
jgi:hypothetical protein